MNIQSLIKNARLCLRSEVLVAEIRLRSYGRRLAFTGLAVLAALMGLAFINLAAFAYLQSMWGPVWTPLAIGIANFALAALALAAAALARPGPELAMAEELRKLSGTALESELQSALPGGGLLGALGGAGDSNAIRLLIPAIISIIGAMRQRKDTAKK